MTPASPSPSGPEFTVIAPCYNEELNVEPLCARMLAAFDTMAVPCELVLVDDGSKDATWDRIREASARDPRVRGVRHEKNKGMVGGWKTGLDHAAGAVVCLIDSDLQNRPEDVPRLYAAFVEQQPDVVQAVRHAEGNLSRLIFSKVLCLLLNVTFLQRLRDNKSGFIVCRRELLQDILGDAAGYRYFQNFLGAAIGVRGLRVAEVDTAFDARVAGESFLSDVPVMTSLKILREMVRYRVDTLLRRRS